LLRRVSQLPNKFGIGKPGNIVRFRFLLFAAANIDNLTAGGAGVSYASFRFPAGSGNFFLFS
jgi:hypothetical protein